MQHGLEGEATYEYEGADNMCRFNEQNVVANISGFGVVWPSEEALKEAVATQVTS